MANSSGGSRISRLVSFTATLAPVRFMSTPQRSKMNPTTLISSRSVHYYMVTYHDGDREIRSHHSPRRQQW